jgi:ribosomal protein S18 acetylase RimI-like enzyme
MLTESHNREDNVRDYTLSDRERCLALFDGNVPLFFAVSERPDFAQFLDKDALDGSYQVLERRGRVVACGGFTVGKDGKTASLCWGMVDRGLQGSGLGSALTQARLAALAKRGVTQVKLDTSQHTQAFYARFGFQVVAITEDGYGAGLDRWDMLLSL